MKFGLSKTVLEVATLLYGVAIVLVARLWGAELLPLGWIVPAFFYLYEGAFVWLFGRYEKMQPQKVLIVSMAMRGVKFLAVAAMMLVWEAAELPAKTPFLLYVLGYYLITSLCEGWSVTAYHKERDNKSK